MTTPVKSLAEARIWLQADLSHAELFELDNGLAVVYTARAPGKATGSEDAVALIPLDIDTCVLAVADGLGGQPAGEAASKLVLKTLHERVIATASDPVSLTQAIVEAINEANHALLAQGAGAATTVAVAAVQGSTARWYHVGDSAILIMDSRGKIKLHTTAHSPVGYALESGLLNEAEAMQHAQRNIVSNVVGMQDMRIEIGASLDLARHDTLLIASDGLTDNLYIQEIAVRACGAPPDQAARRLIEDSQGRMQGDADTVFGHADDLSFVLFRPHPRFTNAAPGDD